MQQFFLQKLDDIDVTNIWFQQDSATCHIVSETIQLLHETFPGHVLSRFGDQNWLPRSCDLILLDFFLWGYLKSKVYVNNSTTTHYKRKLNAVSMKFSHNYAERKWRIIKNFDERVRMCQQSRGGHLPDVLFHK